MLNVVWRMRAHSVKHVPCKRVDLSSIPAHVQEEQLEVVVNLLSPPCGDRDKRIPGVHWQSQV